MCEVCPDDIVLGEAWGYIAAGPVHLSCVPGAEVVCRKKDCNLIHAGNCY